MQKNRTGLILGLVFGGLGLLALLVVGGCAGLYYFGSKRAEQVKEEQAATAASLPTRDEFRAKWMGKTKEEVLAAFGKPTRTTEQNNDTTWHYGNMFIGDGYARDPVTGKPLLLVNIGVGRDGRVTRVEF